MQGPVHHHAGAAHHSQHVHHHPSDIHKLPPGSGKALLTGSVITAGLAAGPVVGPIIFLGGAAAGAGWLVRRLRSR
jgi:hypothetical protein